MFVDQEKVSDYEMKLMDLDVEQLGIPVRLFIKHCNVDMIVHVFSSVFSNGHVLFCS